MIIPCSDTKTHIRLEFSNRDDGDMRNQHNIEAFLLHKQMNGIPYVLAEQVHDIEVKYVSDEWNKREVPGVDGLVSNTIVALVVRTADCVPLLFYDVHNKVIGAAHSGWKGTYSNIVKNCLDLMKQYGASGPTIELILGPHIRHCCYSVDSDRGELFLNKYGNDSVTKDGRVYYLHLDRVITQQAIAEGVSENHIAISTQCTSTVNDLYFSYRKDSLTTFGEQVGVIALLQER